MKFASFILAIAAVFAATPLQASNDSFAEATDLTPVAMPMISYWIGGAGTAETGEPAHAGSPAAQSYWFQWQAPFSGPMAWGEYVNGTNSRLAVYTGDKLTGLTPVVQGTSNVFFQAVEGTRYFLVIDSPSYDVVYLKNYPAGGADDVESADVIPETLPQHVRGNNIFATAAPTDEDWYPDSDPASTVWWKWTAPADGAIRFDTRLCDFGTLLWAGSRKPGGTLTNIAKGFQAVAFPVTAGYEYYFCVDRIITNNPGTIDFWLDWIPAGAPDNDNLANARNLGNGKIVCDGNWLRFATPEASAPNEDIGYPQWSIPGDRTLWWKWTCPQSGHYRFSLQGSDNAPVITIYDGEPGALGLIASAENIDGVRVAVTAGTTYWIQIKDWRKIYTLAELSIYPAETESSYFDYLVNFAGYIRLRGSQRHPNADPDGDGVCNVLELAFGANPEQYNPNDSGFPRILPNGSGGKKLQWRHNSTFLEYSSVDSTLIGKRSVSLGAWGTATTTMPETGLRSFDLPTGQQGFGRVEYHDPNWDLP